MRNDVPLSEIDHILFTRLSSCFCSSTVITLEIRSLTMNGLIFYAADSETDPKNFISLELVNGRLRYQFSSATGQVVIESTRRYALDGDWYKVTLLKFINVFVKICENS